MEQTQQPALKLVVLETTRRCNLRCIHCAVSEENNGGVYAAEDLPIELFRKLLPMFREFKPVVQLSGHGETLLHPHFVEMLEEVAGAGCSPILQTNGSLLNARFVDHIVRQGVELLVVSIDGASPEVFDRIRRRASLEKILANLRRLNEAKEQLNRKTPHLGLEFVAFRQNIHELPGVIKLAGELGAAHVQVAELHELNLTRGESLVNDALMTEWAEKAEEEARNWDLKLILPPHIPGRGPEQPAQELVNIANAAPPTAVEESAAAPSAAAAEAENPAESPHKDLRKTCREPWEKISVQYNGDVWPCCVITESYGNLGTQSFEEIWSGPKYQALRASLTSDQPYPICVECPFYGWEPIVRKPEEHLLRLLQRLHCPDPETEVAQIAAGKRALRDVCHAMLEAGAPSDEVFVERVYRRLLDRAPDTAGFRGWVQALQNGSVNRTKVVRDFLSSEEFNRLLAPFALGTAPPYQPGNEIHFGAGREGSHYTGEGWAAPEEWGIWTDGPTAELRIPLARPLDPGSFLTIHAGAYLPEKHPALRVRVLCEGETIGQWPVTRPDPVARTVRIPETLRGRPELALALHVDSPACPAHYGNGNDHRLLGLGVRALRIGPRSVKEVWRGVYSSLFER